MIALAGQVIDPEDQLFSPGQTAPKGTLGRREIQAIAEEGNGSPLRTANFDLLKTAVTPIP